jgi:hypothetical protein
VDYGAPHGGAAVLKGEVGGVGVGVEGCEG